MIYNRAMDFRWDDEKKVGVLLFKSRAFHIEGYLDEFNCRKRAEEMAVQRGWKRPSDKIYNRVSERSF